MSKEISREYYEKAGFNELFSDFLQANETIRILEEAIDERDNLIETIREVKTDERKGKRII